MIFRNYLKQAFCKTNNFLEKIKRLDERIEKVRKQHLEISKLPLSADIHAKLIANAT